MGRNKNYDDNKNLEQKHATDPWKKASKSPSFAEHHIKRVSSKQHVGGQYHTTITTPVGYLTTHLFENAKEQLCAKPVRAHRKV